MNHTSKAVVTWLFAAFLASCTLIPTYQQPTDTSQSAHLKLAFRDESLLSGVAVISRLEGNIVCGEPLPNYQRMIIISKGNPLISDLNVSGVLIPTGRKFTFSAMGLNDGFRECGRIVSFIPKAGSRYEITLANSTTRIRGAEPSACPIELVDVSSGISAKEPVEISYEQCSPRK